MGDLADMIRERIDDPIDVALNGVPYVEAIRAVLDLHKRVEAQRTFGDHRPVCKECDDGRSVPVWPCPTVTLMASAMCIPEGGSGVETNG